MGNVKILDCTLRDGGYINNWFFGTNNIINIISDVADSRIEIIEIGYLALGNQTSTDEARFSSLEQIDNILPSNANNSCVVAMANCGDLDIDLLPERGNHSLAGIRVVFHKTQINEAFSLCEKIKEKGYKVFVQPMSAMRYSDMEFISLIEQANKLMPYAFYIVDSNGSMKKRDVVRYYNLAENNLQTEISLGFHSHNNLQLSYSNAQTFVGMGSDRELIVDSSIFGMGRGAGNLNTELFIGYLNNIFHANYCVEPILKTIDTIIEKIYKKTPWGYSLPYYLSASYKCHPNYAGFLRDKQTLTFSDMNAIFTLISENKKDEYDKNYIESLYFEYLCGKNEKWSITTDFSAIFSGKNIVIVAPGKSVSDADEAKKIAAVIKQENAVVIAINHISDQIKCDYVFVSNLRRSDMIAPNAHRNLIVTSNIKKRSDVKYVVDYSALINHTEHVEDNAVLMLIALLIKSQSSSIWLAGVDGYIVGERNYFDDKLESFDRKVDYQARNMGLEIMLDEYAKIIPIEFITNTRLRCLDVKRFTE